MMQVEALTTARFNPNRAAPTNKFFSDAIVFRKTISGRHEFEHHGTSLRAELRRLLVLVDGKREAQSLTSCFRSGELPRLLRELCELGLIESTSCESVLTDTSIADAVLEIRSLTDAQFKAVRTAAMHAASELLGALGKPHCAALGACKELVLLRTLLTKLGEQIKSTLGADASTLLFAIVRDAAATGARA